MAESSYPFDSGDTTETQYSQLFRRLQNSGVWASPTATELKVSATTGLVVSVAAGFAMVRGHFYINDSAKNLTLAAGSASPRIDLIVLRLDPTANSIVAAILAGTPSATPVAPTPTQTDTGVYEVPLAQIAVAASTSSISSGNITDIRSYMGMVVGLWSTARRPSAPRIGQSGFNTDLGYSEEWNGTTWRATGLPTTIDATSVNGHGLYTGTTDPAPSFGPVGSVYFKHEA